MNLALQHEATIKGANKSFSWGGETPNSFNGSLSREVSCLLPFFVSDLLSICIILRWAWRTELDEDF